MIIDYRQHSIACTALHMDEWVGQKRNTLYAIQASGKLSKPIWQVNWLILAAPDAAPLYTDRGGEIIGYNSVTFIRAYFYYNFYQLYFSDSRTARTQYNAERVDYIYDGSNRVLVSA